MNKKYLSILIVLFISLIGISKLIKPDNKELSYVYEKSNNLEKLKDLYSVNLEEDPNNLELQQKYKNTLEQLKDNDYIEYSKEFYKKTKDLKTIEKIVYYYKENKDFENSLIWLEELYSQTKDQNTLQEIIDLTSFTKQIDTQKKYLLLEYEKNKDINVLFDLYNIGEKEFSLNELFTLASLEKLDEDAYNKTFKYLIYAKDFEKANSLYFKHNLIDKNLQQNKDLYIYLNEHYKNTNELKNIYLKLFEQTKKREYFENLEYFYVDQGDIKDFLQMHKKKYEKTKSKSSLDILIRYSNFSENKLDYLHYLELKAIEEENDEIIKSIISEYIDLDEETKLQNFLEKISIFGEKNENIRDILINSYIYLEQHDKAEKYIYSYNPKDIQSNLVYLVFQDKINESNEAYFLNALSKDTDENLLKKLFIYKYKKGTLFNNDTYEYFVKPNTFKKLNFYTQYFSKQEKEKIYFNFSLKLTDPQFLAQIAQYFLNENNYLYSKEISKNALSIYPNNQLALKTIALSSLWQKNYDESLKYLKELSSIDKNNIEIMFYLAQIHEQKKENNTAKEYYKKITELTKEEKKFYLISKAKLSNPKLVKNSFEKLIEESNYNEYLISDYINLFYDIKDYDTVFTLLDKYNNTLKNSNVLQKIKIQTYLAKKDIENSKKLMETYEEKNLVDDDLKYFYQDLANLYFNNNRKDLALENYKISQKLGLKSNSLNKQIEKLDKYLSSSLTFNSGIQNEIKQTGIEAEYVDKFRAKFKYERLENYNSAKVEFSDLNENYTLGLGKEYYKLQFNNILNQPLSLYTKKEIDRNSVSTINDKLIYKKYGIKYQSNLFENLYLTSSLNYFDYEKYDFNRLRFENSFYYTFENNYYINLTYIFENVKGKNPYGYDDLSYPILAFGSNNTLYKNLSYDANFGFEYKQSEFNPFANANLYYDSKTITSSLVNSVSKDDLTNKYKYNTMINFSYNFLN